MQSGIDSSRLRIAAENVMPTKADVQPEVHELSQLAPASGSSKGFFGPEGPSFRDVLDAVNPLNHIPIVSDLFAAATGHEASTASKLAGGALLGGPIGFAASLVSVIFEEGAGKTPGAAAYAAITGDTTSLVAKADIPADTPEELASLEPAASPTMDAMQAAAAPVMPVSVTTSAIPSTSNAVLDLYGASDASAHASYRKAQLLPYLRDVNHSKVL